MSIPQFIRLKLLFSALFFLLIKSEARASGETHSKPANKRHLFIGCCLFLLDRNQNQKGFIRPTAGTFIFKVSSRVLAISRDL